MNTSTVKKVYLYLGIVLMIISFFIESDKQFYLFLGLTLAMFSLSLVIFTSNRAFVIIFISSVIMVVASSVGFHLHAASLNGLLILIAGLISLLTIFGKFFLNREKNK